ncbi:MAG: glycosyltransferase family 39 protein [Chloroflexi bacterium]|nr:glycosyltransferase family 39 protein [Chloroflexota bacterium]
MTRLTAPLLHRELAIPLGLLLASGVLALLLDLPMFGFAVVVGGFGLAGHGLASPIVPARTRLDLFLASLTFGFATFATAAEVLSLVVLLGSERAWVVAAAVCGAAATLGRGAVTARAGKALTPRPPHPVRGRGGASSPSPAHRERGSGGEGLPLASRIGWAAAALLILAAGLLLATEFVLSFFAGINVGDSLTHYMPRSVRFVQYGTFGLNDANYYEFMQYFHQTVVAVQLLFLRTDVLVNPFSFLAASATTVVVYALARGLGWPKPYPVFAALTPLAMPMLLLHTTTSNFDTFIALWIVSALYFLRRGFALSQRGWLLAAATATALAFATKPTVWFVMPGLGLVWLATLGRAAVRRRLPRAIPTFAACAVIFVLVGMPFLLRNMVSRGYVIAPPQWQEFQLGQRDGTATGPLHRLRLLEFNTLALGLQVLTPPSLLPDRFEDGLDPWFTRQAQALGFRLPDASITVHTDWPGLIRHVSHRYDSNHTGLGASFLLVTLPSLVALPFARRRLGVRWWYAIGLAIVGLSYFVALNTVSIYSVNNIRYLIEMVAVLAALGPTLFVLLPTRLGAALALVVGAILVGEMQDVVQHNKQAPPDLVLRVPRPEQYFVFNGNPPTPARAAAVLDQKYPPDEIPDVYVEDTGVPNFPDYTVLGPSLLRRTHYQRTPASAAELRGPFLTRERALVEKLTVGGQALADQLSADVWLVLPNDRPRVLFWPSRAPSGDLVLKLQASMPPGQFADPRYAFSLRTVRGEERLRGFEPSPTLDVPFDVAGRGTIQVEIRDGENTRRIERVRIERPRYMGL